MEDPGSLMIFKSCPLSSQGASRRRSNISWCEERSPEYFRIGQNPQNVTIIWKLGDTFLFLDRGKLQNLRFLRGCLSDSVVQSISCKLVFSLSSHRWIWKSQNSNHCVFYVYECLVCTHIYYVHVVSMEAGRGSWIPLELEFQADMRYHLGAGN